MIDWSIIPLKQRKQKYREISSGKDLALKTAMLYKMYKGADCLLLNCGPSTAEFSEETIANFCKDKVLMTVKTTTQKFKNVTDIHVSNFYATFQIPNSNDRNYITLTRQEMPLGYQNWINEDLIDHETHCITFESEPDTLWGSDVTARHSNSVVNANRWEENSLRNSPYNRIIGPGIMNDMVVPILVHIGIKKVSILGWDGAPIEEDGSIKHFYDLEPEYKPTMNYVSNKFNLKNLKSDTHECEQEIAKRGEDAVLNYLNNNDIEVEILTKHSGISDNVKRNYELYNIKQ